LRRIIAAVVFAFTALACSDSSSGPAFVGEETSTDISVSDPSAIANAGPPANAVNIATAAAFISAPPGKFPTGFAAEISNETKGTQPAIVPIKDGGFDPIALPADPGDEVQVKVMLTGGQSTIVAAKVPIRRPPTIVRSSPAKGRADVALNVLIEVVFSEPVAPSTVSSSTVALRRDGIAVPATVQVSEDGLRAILTPDSPLSPSTSYVILVYTGVLDTDGDALAYVLSADFTTQAVPDFGSVTVTTVSSASAGADLDSDGYTVSIDGGAPRPIGINATATFGTITEGNHNVTLGDVHDDCLVANGATRQITMEQGGTVSLTFTVTCETPLRFSGMLAFVSERDGPSNIYVANLDGTGIVNLSAPNADETDPAWSPDGQRIAFVRGSNWDTNIHIMNADGTNRRQLTSFGRWSSSPAWSPDGKQIAFSSVQDGQGGIFVIDVDAPAAVPRRIGYEAGQIYHPAWAPDGSAIAFVSDWRAYDFLFDIYVMKPDGSDIKPLITGPFFWVDGLKFYFQPTWSPDGTKLAVVHCTYSWDNCYPQSTIAVANADGSGLTMLAGSAGYSHPTWSPDGRTIAYSVRTCRTCAGAAIRYVKSDGSRNGLLIPNAHSPAWRPEK
jgi:TolB protein